MNSHGLRILSPRAAVLGFTLSLAAAPLAAQCQLEWQAGPASPGPNNRVYAMATAANGDLFVGGQFTVAGNAVTANVARYDGATWHALGSGIDGRVDALAILPNGDLIAGGAFEFAGNAQAHNIARWDGSDWFAMAGGLDGSVADLAVMPNGNLVVVGDFTTAGGFGANRAAIWNGIGWSPLGSGPSASEVRTVTVQPNGNIVVGGQAFVGVPDLERWDGSTWSPLAGIATSSLTSVDHVLAMPNGDVVIAAVIYNVGPLGIWDGTQLLPLSVPFSNVADIALDTNGDLLVLGFDGANMTPPVARFDGTNWSFVGNYVENGYSTMTVGDNGSIHVGRGVLTNETQGTSNIARLQFGQWVPLAVDPLVAGMSLLPLPNGDVLFGGEFLEVEGVAANNIIRRTSTGWQPLTQGVDGRVIAMALAPDGSVVVCGGFTQAGGTPAPGIARWNGSSWSTLGAGLSGQPAAPNLVAVNDAGDVLAQHGSDLMLFDGQSWSNVGSNVGSAVAIAAIDNGDFLLAGTFIVLGQSPILNGMLRVSNGTLTVEPTFGNRTLSGMVEDGAGGVLLTHPVGFAATVKRFDGNSVVTIGSAPNYNDLRVPRLMPNGDLLAIAATGSALQPARWNGTTWSTLPGSPVGTPVDLCVGLRGEVFVAGNVVQSGNVVSVGIARAETTCPTVVTTFGSGCTGSAGPVALSTDDRPWIGTSITQTATGMAPLSIGMHVVGLQATAVPLPLGAPGCSLIVVPTVFAPLTPQNGIVEAPLAIPNSTALIAQQLFTQVVGIELDANVAITQLTSSNALQLTIGAF